MHTTNNNHCVAIIGAGPAGLSAARVLKQLGIPYRIFEKHEDVGGIWDASNPGSPMYRSAHFISSRTMSGHMGFPMPEDYPDYPSHKQILAYIRSFADHYQLRDNIVFNTKVNRADFDPAREQWILEIQTGETPPEKQAFRWLICASGTNWLPNRPRLKGEEDFLGEVLHSVDYHDPETLLGKRVLIVGAGNSGVDIACDAAFNADQAFISLRRGYHFVPKHIFGMPADVFGAQSSWMPMKAQQFTFGALLRLLQGDLTRLGLPKPDHKVLSSHPILNSQILHYLQHGDISAKPDIDRLDEQGVHFTDGSYQHIDTIILATGYHWHLPYLDEKYFQWQHHRPKTFMKIFNPAYPSLFINGFIETNGGAYKLFDQMSYLIGRTIETQLKQPDKARQIKQFINGPEPDLSGRISYVQSNRHAGYTNSDAFLKAAGEMCKRFNWPGLSEAFFKDESAKHSEPQVS